MTPVLAPDATGLGQVFYYVLEPSATTNLADLRSLQDYVIKLALESVEGVSEVASIGGYTRQYQVEVDPERLRYYQLPLNRILDSVRAANAEVGAKTVETSGYEFLIRGKGFLGSGKDEVQTISELEETVIETRDGIPIRLRDVASVQTGPAFRTGALDWNGQEAVGGIVVMRYRENPRTVIDRVKAKLASLEPELGGVTVRAVYDRTTLINETMHTLNEALLQETLVTIVIVVLFLLHFRSSLIIAVALPLAVLLSFIAMRVFRIDANIMSLAGIAIAIGTMVDMGIIVLENIYDRLADWELSANTLPSGERERQRLELIGAAAVEVAPAVVTAVSTTIVSFLPVFFLTGRDARLFTPLAWTKTFAITASLLVAITLVPALCRLFLRSGNKGPLTGPLIGMVLGSIGALTSYFVWGETLVAWVEAQQITGFPVALGPPGLRFLFSVAVDTLGIEQCGRAINTFHD